MAGWQGFDSGGVEQIWDDDIIVQGLVIFHENEPFDRSDEHAPFFDQLEEQFPDITWRERDKWGSFRPIFRRANPWVKLGLTSPETKGAVVTPLGHNVLSGEIQLKDVYIDATKIFEERDGTRSFAKICQCAMLLPEEVFSLEDIEYAVSKDEGGTAESFLSLLHIRRKNAQRFPEGARRSRALKRMMNSLVSAGALMKVASGWKLASVAIAQEIFGHAVAGETVRASNFVELKKRFVSNVKVIAPGRRQIRTVSPAISLKLDPVHRALLLERAHSEHETIVEKCAALIRELGGDPVEDLNSFDVACYERPRAIFEAKSITSNNCYSQLRRAVSQLPEYRWRHREKFDSNTTLVIALNQDPRPWVDREYLDYILEDRDILVIWLAEDVLTDLEGREAREILSQTY